MRQQQTRSGAGARSAAVFGVHPVGPGPPLSCAPASAAVVAYQPGNRLEQIQLTDEKGEFFRLGVQRPLEEYG